MTTPRLPGEEEALRAIQDRNPELLPTAEAVLQFALDTVQAMQGALLYEPVIAAVIMYAAKACRVMRAILALTSTGIADEGFALCAHCSKPPSTCYTFGSASLTRTKRLLQRTYWPMKWRRELASSIICESLRGPRTLRGRQRRLPRSAEVPLNASVTSDLSAWRDS